MQTSSGHARSPKQARVIRGALGLAVLPCVQGPGCSCGASGLEELEPRCVQPGNRAYPRRPQSRTELCTTRGSRTRCLVLETPGWGNLSADKGVHEPLAPLFRCRDPLPGPIPRSHSSCSPSATTQAPAASACARARGRGLARTPHSGAAQAGGRCAALRVSCVCLCLCVCARARACGHVCVCACVSVRRAGGRVSVRAGAPVREPLGVRACVMGLIPEQVAHWSWVALRLRSCLGVLLLIVSEVAEAAAPAAAAGAAAHRQQLSGTAGRTVQKRAPFGESGGRVRGRRGKACLGLWDYFSLSFPLSLS